MHAFGRRKPGGIGRGRGGFVFHRLGFKHLFAVHKRYGVFIDRPFDVNRIAVFDFGILCKRLQKVRVAIQSSGVSFFLKTERE